MVVWHIIGLAVVAGLLPLTAPWLGFVFTLAVGKGFAALGVAMLLRGGLISIGHAMFFAIGAYAAAFLMLGALVGGLIVGIVESLTGFYIGGEYKLLATFSLLVLILLVRPYGLFGTHEIERL